MMTITLDNGVLHVARPDDTKASRSLHGLTRSLLNNMVVGVTHGFEKKLRSTASATVPRRRARKSS